MVVYNDEINARFNVLTGQADTGLQALLVKLGAVENRAMRVNRQLHSLGRRGATGQKSMFGAMLNVDARDMPGYKLSNSLLLAEKAMAKSEIQSKRLYETMFPSKKTTGFTSFDDLWKPINKAGKEMAQMKEHTKQMNKMGAMFGLLFGGMQMQRYGLSIMRFVLPSMEKLEGYTSEGTKKISAMNAAFQFLKFSMFETFTQTALFKNVVDFLIQATNWLSEFVSKHPSLTVVLASIGGLATILGSIMIPAGFLFQMSMLNSSLKTLATNSNLAAGGITAAETSMFSFSNLLKKGIGLGFIIKGGKDFFDAASIGDIDSMDFWTQLGEGALFTALGLKLIGAGSFALPVAIGLSFYIAGMGFIKKISDSVMRDSIANEYAGVTAEAIKTGQELAWQDPTISDNYMKGFQGTTTVPDFVNESWTKFGDTAAGTVTSIGLSIDETLINTSLPNLDTAFINTGATAQTQIINRWENWTPSTKTLKIKVEKSGSSDGPGFSSNAFTSSITG